MSLIKKIAPIILSGSLLFSGSLLLTANTSANELSTQENVTVSTASEKEEYLSFVRNELKKYDTADATIDILVSKLANGESWDSLNPEKSGTATEVKLNENETKLVFPDGSFIIQTFGSVPEEGAITPMADVGRDSQTKVTYTLGATIYQGMNVTGNAVIFTATYKADFTLVKDGYDSIQKVYDRRVIIPGSGTNYEVEKWGIQRATENSYEKARANFTFKVNTALSTNTIVMNLLVGNDTYTADGNV